MIISNALCPVSSAKINERVARLNGGFTFALLLLFLLTQNILVIGFLSVDFLIRSGSSGKSPVSLASKALVNVFQTGKKMMNAGPKIFAARIGLLFSILILIAFIADFTSIVYILTLIISIFSFLESVFGVCVACKLYPYLFRIFNKSVKKGISGSKAITYARFSDQ